MILDAPACAALLRCSTAHLQRLARSGGVPACKIGTGWVFIEEDIVTWLRERSKIKPVAKRGRPRVRLP